jgi:uncharacterized protein (TIGR02266 family)
MGKKSKKRAKKKTRTMLPPRREGEASAQPLAVLAAGTPQPLTAALPTSVPVEEEHRTSQRVSFSVELHMASESHFFSGLSGDISEGGVFVSTYRALSRGSQVDLEFTLPGTDRVVHARGEVRWQRDASPDAPPGVGIAFEDLPEEDRRVIHQFCSIRPPLYYDDVG